MFKNDLDLLILADAMQILCEKIGGDEPNETEDKKYYRYYERDFQMFHEINDLKKRSISHNLYENNIK
jgi:hypothetical protein